MPASSRYGLEGSFKVGAQQRRQGRSQQAIVKQQAGGKKAIGGNFRSEFVVGGCHAAQKRGDDPRSGAEQVGGRVDLNADFYVFVQQFRIGKRC